MQNKLIYYVKLLLVTVVTLKLNKHTACRPRQLTVIQAAPIGFYIRIGELWVMRLFLNTAGSPLTVYIVYKQHESNRTTLNN